MKTPSARAAVQAGLLLFPPGGSAFPGRTGVPLPFLIDSRGAGTNLPLRRTIVRGLRGLAATAADFDVIGGVSKAGTIWAAWLAWAEQRPYATVHLDGPRRSGLQRAVEGDVRGKRILLVDNWVRSGESVRRAAEVAAEAGAVPVGAIAIVATGDPAVGIPLQAVWEVGQLVRAAEQAGLREERS
jgi:orotate phosphoribosyltransferase